MDVMAARVHDAVVYRGEGDLVFFGHRKSVDVRANHDSSPGLRATKDRDGTGLRRTRRELPAEFDEPVTHDLGRAAFLEGEFGMGVEVVSNLHHGRVNVVEQSW